MPSGIRDLSSQTGIKLIPRAVEVQSLNHWTVKSHRAIKHSHQPIHNNTFTVALQVSQVGKRDQ